MTIATNSLVNHGEANSNGMAEREVSSTIGSVRPSSSDAFCDDGGINWPAAGPTSGSRRAADADVADALAEEEKDAVGGALGGMGEVV